MAAEGTRPRREHRAPGGGLAAQVKLEGASSGELRVQPPRWNSAHPSGLLAPPQLGGPKFFQPLCGACELVTETTAKVPVCLPSSSRAAPLRTRAGGGERPGGSAQATEADLLPPPLSPDPAPQGFLLGAHPRPSAGSEGQAFTGVESPGTLGAAVPGPAPQVPRAGRFSGPLDGSGQWGRPSGEPVLIWGERESPEWGTL